MLAKLFKAARARAGTFGVFSAVFVVAFCTQAALASPFAIAGLISWWSVLLTATISGLACVIAFRSCGILKTDTPHARRYSLCRR